jgi:hypothetical protein
MDAACKPAQDDQRFRLQIQQTYLKKYILQHEWDRLLLYHGIGSGKTCTAITLAETWIEKNPQYSATVILPARLRTNFIDELVSPCGGERYLDEATFARYVDKDTSDYQKKKIRAAFVRGIEEVYDILSFEKWKRGVNKDYGGSLKKWVTAFTKNNLIVIDEVHNLCSNNYKMAKWKEFEKSGDKMINCKGNSTMLLKYMCRHAHESCRMLFLTATPVFDNIGNIRELVEALTGKAVSPGTRISDVFYLLKGCVSYFPGSSPVAYPEVVYTLEEIPLTASQDTRTFQLQLDNDDDMDDEAEMFMTKQRQISLSTSSAIHDMEEQCPKIKRCVDLVQKLKGSKHLVYSSFVKYGVNVVRDALESAGWVNLKSLGYRETEDPDVQYKVFAVWDGTTKDIDKQKIKALVNGRANRFGKFCRVVIGSPSMKEGVSFKHIQHMHLLDPVWNLSSKLQVEGRAIRFCSHVELPASARKVNVHIYKSVPRAAGGQVERTCDQIIYDVIMPKKEAQIRAGEKALKALAVDRRVFQHLYAEDATAYQDYSISNLKRHMKTSSCPKKRRPFLDRCPPKHPYLRLNPRNDECCYVGRRAAAPRFAA